MLLLLQRICKKIFQCNEGRETVKRRRWRQRVTWAFSLFFKGRVVFLSHGAKQNQKENFNNFRMKIYLQHRHTRNERGGAGAGATPTA